MGPKISQTSGSVRIVVAVLNHLNILVNVFRSFYDQLIVQTPSLPQRIAEIRTWDYLFDYYTINHYIMRIVPISVFFFE